MRCRNVEKRARWHRVRDPNGIDSERGHLREIALYQPVVGIFVTSRVRPERAISYAARKKGLAVRGKKLAVDGNSFERFPQRLVPHQKRAGNRRPQRSNGRPSSDSDRGQGRVVTSESSPVDAVDFAIWRFGRFIDGVSCTGHAGSQSFWILNTRPPAERAQTGDCAAARYSTDLLKICYRF